jgi:lysozyme
MSRQTIFDAIRTARGEGFTASDVVAIDTLLDHLGIARDGASAKGRQANEAGLNLIRTSEGCRLTAYRDVAGIPTIGYGHTGPEVHMGQTISQAEAERLFDADTDKFEAAVDRLTKGKATDNQFSALVSFAYNLGADALAGSTLLRLHNSGDYAGAADQFKLWNKAKVNSKLVPVSGLTTRRMAEAALYRSGA